MNSSSKSINSKDSSSAFLTNYLINRTNKKLRLVLIGATITASSIAALYAKKFNLNNEQQTIVEKTDVSDTANSETTKNEKESSDLYKNDIDNLILNLKNEQPSYIYSSNIENLISLPRYQNALICIKHANLYPNKQNRNRVLDELEKLSDYHNYNSIRININDNKYATKLDDLIKLKINKNYQHINPFLNKGLALYISQQLSDDLMLELAFKKPHVDNRFFRTEPPTTIVKLNKILGRVNENVMRNIYEDTDYALLFEFYDNFVKLFLKKEDKDSKNAAAKNSKSKFYSNKELINLINKLNNEINSLILSEYSVQGKAKLDVWSDTYLEDFLDETVRNDENSSKSKIKDLKHKHKFDYIERNEQLILNIVELMTKIDLKEFINLGGMEFLLLLYEKHKYDDVYLYSIGNCLTWISLNKNYQKLFIQSGWVKRLNKMLNKKKFKNDESTIHIPDNINLIRELIAHKILFNLITQNENILYSTEIYPLHPNYSDLLIQNENLIQSNNEHNHMVDVIFIHGLRGSLFRTWRQDDHVVDGSNDLDQQDQSNHSKNLNFDTNNKIFDKNFLDNLNNLIEINVNNDEKTPSICWPRDWMPQDLIDPENVRIIGIDYQSSYSLWGQELIDDKKLKLNIKQRAIDLLDQLKLANVGSRPIVWICHSMGGLIVKQMLVEYAEMNKKMNIVDDGNNILKNTRGIIFMSTPHLGSSIAKTATKFSFALNPSPEVLELAADSAYLVDLNKKFLNLIKSSTSLMKNMKILSFCENMPTYIGYFNIYAKTVSEKSANLGIGEFKLVDFKDHLNICKPDNRNCAIYQDILKIVDDLIKNENLNCQECQVDFEKAKNSTMNEYLYEFFLNAHNLNF